MLIYSKKEEHSLSQLGACLSLQICEVLLNINTVREHQPQTRPLCDGSGARKNKATS